MEIKKTDKGNDLCYESFYGTYFRSSYSSLIETMYNMNGKLTFDNTVTMEDVYKSLGLSNCAPPIASQMGWNDEFMYVEYETPAWIDFYISTKIAPTGEPCMVLNYTLGPISLPKWKEYVDRNLY